MKLVGVACFDGGWSLNQAACPSITVSHFTPMPIPVDLPPARIRLCDDPRVGGFLHAVGDAIMDDGRQFVDEVRESRVGRSMAF